MKIKTIFSHEFKTFALNKTFLILTLIGPFLIIAVTVLPALISMNISEKISIAIFSDNQILKDQISSSLSNLMKLFDIEKIKEKLIEKNILSQILNLKIVRI